MDNRSAERVRVLIVDDVVPEEALGAGYPRLLETIAQIQSVPGAKVSFFPTLDHRHASNELGAVRPWTGDIPIEIITTELENHLARVERSGDPYDVVVISRPHNYEYVIEMIRRYLPGTPVIYDSEALFYRRMERQLEFCPERDRSALARATKEMRRLEEQIAGDVEELVFVSDEEADILRPFAKGGVSVNSPLLKSMSWTKEDFAERSDVAFVASWSSGANSPNVDGMIWFAREVWPRVLARLPEAKLTVTGDRAPREVLRFSCDSIAFVGRVEDLRSFYARTRVVIVANRYGAGVKNKTIEALQSGIPTVSTTVGAEGVPLSGPVDGASVNETGPPSFLSVTDDATEFAERIAVLLGNEAAWKIERERLRLQCEDWDRSRKVQTWPLVINRIVASRALSVKHV